MLSDLDDLKKNHPLGKSPQITIESANIDKPLVLAESGMMTEYLVEHFAPHLAPKKWQEGKDGQVGGETAEWLRYRYYMHFAEGSLMSFLLLGLVIDREYFSPQFVSTDTYLIQKSARHRSLSSSSPSPEQSLARWMMRS